MKTSEEASRFADVTAVTWRELVPSCTLLPWPLVARRHWPRMVAARAILLAALAGVALCTHYNDPNIKPGCAADEVEGDIKGLKGDICFPFVSGLLRPSALPVPRLFPRTQSSMGIDFGKTQFPVFQRCIIRFLKTGFEGGGG